jgi:hypothetical protein
MHVHALACLHLDGPLYRDLVGIQVTEKVFRRLKHTAAPYKFDGVLTVELLSSCVLLGTARWWYLQPLPHCRGYK